LIARERLLEIAEDLMSRRGYGDLAKTDRLACRSPDDRSTPLKS
jgi:hypothetical protein